MRKLICISPEGHLDCDELVISYVVANWNVKMVLCAEAALALTDLADYRVATVMFGQDSSTWISEPEIEALNAAYVSLVALATPETMHKEGVRALVAQHFYDYHTLPVNAAQLLATLGHAHGMSALRAKAASRLKAYSAREEKSLGRLIAYVQSLREAERSRIARDVHDELGQSLTAIKFKLCEMIADQSGFPTPAKTELNSLVSMIDELIGATQRIATELRPAILDSLGLVSACEWLVDRHRQRTGLNCGWVCDDLGVKIDAEQSTALFRILQETLTNVARHAEATQIKVSLSRQGRDLVLQVSDDGKGLNPEAERECPALGLLGIRERATMLGGKASFDSSPGAGTRVVVSIPFVASSEGQNHREGDQAAAPTRSQSAPENGSTLVSAR